MNIKALLVGVAFAATASLSAVSANAVEYLVNGGFETGNTTGWLAGPNAFDFTGVEGPGQYAPQEGNFYLRQGVVSGEGSLSQTFVDNPGDILTISGWVIGNGTGYSVVRLLLNGVGLTIGSPVPDQPWTHYSFQGVATGLDTFSISYRNDPDWDGLDNFSVTSGGVPEPTTWALMLSGFFGAGALLRSRRRVAVAA